MREDLGPFLLTRRSALLLVGSGFAACREVFASGGNFWDKKDPGDWSSEEIARLLSKSPWAKEVNAQYAPGEGGYGSPNGGGYPGGQGGGMGGPRIGMGIPGMGGPRGGMGGGRRNGGGGGTRTATSYEKGTVIWESAKPVRAAIKTPLPDAFANHYVISVSGIPLRGDRRRSQTSSDDSDSSRTSSSSADDALDNLKQLTTLTPKGKELAEAGVVARQTNTYSSILFGFSKEFLELTKQDHEVLFETRLGNLVVKAKFDPKEMLYRKELSV